MNSFESIELTVRGASTAGSSVEPPPPAIVRGVVRDERGRPITDLVVAGRTPDNWNTGIRCNSDGEFVFESVPAGTAEFTVGGGERVFVRERFELAPGDTRFLVLQPVMRPSLLVRLTDTRETPLVSWRIEARSAPDGSLMGVSTTGEDGAARMGLYRSERVLLYARPVQRGADPMVLLGSSDFVRDSQLELRAPDEMRAGSIELTLDDRFAGSAEARAWRVDSGEGLVLESAALHDARTQEPPRPKPSLMPGRWRVEVRTPGRPWTSVGECRLAPGEQLDLGLVTLLPCADLVLSSTNPKSTEVQVALRAQIDGAIVTWPGRPVVLPTTIATISGTPLGILSSKTEGGESVLVNPEPRRFDAGSEQVVEIP